MAFGAFTQGKSYRQLWRRSATRTPPLGRGPSSLVLGSDATDETVTLDTGDKIAVTTTGDVNDAQILDVRGTWRFNAPIPEGYGWRLTVLANGVAESLDITETLLTAANFPLELNLSDIALNIAGAGAGVVVGFELELIVDPAAPGVLEVEVVLPSVFIDQVFAPETVASDLFLASRFPAPGQTSVPSDIAQLSFMLVDVAGTGVDLAGTTVTVDGVVAYTASAFVFPWAGTVATGVGPTTNDVLFTLTPPINFAPLDSEQMVEIRVQSQLTGPVSLIDQTWAWIAADTEAPAIQRATMIAKDVLRIQFTDDVLMDTSAGGALNPLNYSTVRVSVPSVTLDVVGVSTVFGHADQVDVQFNWEASMGAIYTVVVKDVLDDGGNVIMDVGQALRFTGYVPPRPRGRRFELLDFIPAMNKREDRTTAQGALANNPGTGELRKFILVLQDVVDLLLCQSDRWTDIIDVDLAPESFLDAILQDLGNPFADCIADLDETDKRRLARVLISIYKQKGTEVGIVNTIRFFLGIETTLDIINCRQFWQLDISQLGVDTLLAPAVGSPLWYSFFITSPVVLTDEQRERIFCIADYMKAAHEHILGIIEPGDAITASNYWILNVSLLGQSPNAGPSTVLA